MATISASMVKELREKTGAGMMDCKAALEANEGEIEASVDWHRKKGLSKAAKKSGRVAAEGLIGLELSATKGVLVEVNSETDFVARNEAFQELVRSIAKVSAQVGTNVESVLAAKHPTGVPVSEALTNAIATIGENMTLRRVAEVSVSAGVVGSYMHAAVADGLGKIGVLVGLQSTGKADELVALGRQIAMHIAASNPQALTAEGLDPAIVEREKAVLADKHTGKPANVVEKIVESGLKTYFKEVCLLEQSFVHDASKTVSQAVKEAEGKVGAPILVTAFVRYALGEGIEKQESDFAAEVAAASGVKA